MPSVIAISTDRAGTPDRHECPGRRVISRTSTPIPVRSHLPSLKEAFHVWLRVAALSFGGPAGQIAVMHRIVVEEKRWISESRFLHALNYCMLLPGPEAQQLATYIGWLMHRTLGGLMAGVLFVAPGVIAIMGLSYVYAAYGNVPVIVALFFGLKAAVLAIVLEAVVRIGKRALKNNVMVAIAAAAFVGIYFFNVPFPVIILGAAVIGLAGAWLDLAAFRLDSGHAAATPDAGVIDSILGDQLPAHARPTIARALRVSAIWLVLWLVPVVTLVATLGSNNVFSLIAVFFSKMALVTFGGAYAVLAYVAQQAVENYGWLKPGEMLDGLGMAETTPGPLIMVLQFVGFMAAFRDPGALSPMLAGTLGGLLATWVTFTPCFLWIFLGAPFIESIRGNRAIASALSAITAAVVGVILNLALWFAVHTIFREVWEVRSFGLSFDAPVLIAPIHGRSDYRLAALVAIFRFRIGMMWTLAACSAVGIVLHLLGIAR